MSKKLKYSDKPDNISEELWNLKVDVDRVNYEENLDIQLTTILENLIEYLIKLEPLLK